MTNKTEDRFYFRRATDSEIEHLLLEAESLMDDGFVSKAIPYLRKASNSIDTNTSPRLKKILADMMREANVRFSRPGQPERFGGFSGLGDWTIDFRNVMKERVDQLKQLAKTLKASVKLNRISPNGYYSGSVSRRYGAMEPPDLNAPGKVKALIQSLGGYIGAGFSRPGQPERFDASSLDRGDFAEASRSPILGKLLAAKAMPEGGWRAVQAGSDTLVISFEDADVAGDFGKRAAAKGFNATSPVQAIGRYWNVEVKNG